MGANSTNNTVYSLVMNGTNNLFVGGLFTSVGGGLISANYIASWNGNSWNFLGITSTNNGLNNQVQTLTMNGTTTLYVGGYFTQTNDGTCSLRISSYLEGKKFPKKFY